MKAADPPVARVAYLVEVGQRSLAGRRVHQIVLLALLTEVVILHTDVSHLRGETPGKKLLDLNAPLLVCLALAEAFGLVRRAAQGLVRVQIHGIGEPGSG